MPISGALLAASLPGLHAAQMASTPDDEVMPIFGALPTASLRCQ